ncbi:hypothetical protein [Methylobacterium tarhaniae]|uniref:hypothetical protein n=1 Tax=Methylobacterium tarhaniae TaxID=1187852 RepID=UPI00069D9E22|nr:hypothetical protein [Methylobacterium tarhaniae]
MLADLRETWALTLGICLDLVGGAAFYAVIAGYLAAAFPTRVRYTGISMASQLCGASAGGLMPIIGTILAETYRGQWWPIATFGSAMAIPSFICVTLIEPYRLHAGEDDSTRPLTPTAPVGVPGGARI